MVLCKADHTPIEGIHPMTIVVNLSGGIGNQLFQLAFARSKSMQLGKQTIVTHEFLKDGAGRNLLPWISNRNAFYSYYELKSKSRTRKLWSYSNEKRRLGLEFVDLNFGKQLILSLPTFFENYRQFVYEFLIADSGYFEGTFASRLYWDRSEFDELRRWILNLLVEYCPSEQSERPFGVSVHARRGDYVTNQKTRNFHGYCGNSYFVEALMRASDLGFTNKGVLISSDDKQCAIDLQQIAKRFTRRVDVVETNNPYRTLIQLTNSKAFIGSNSTFSFWAGYLNERDLRIFPSKWFMSKKQSFSPENLFLDDPILLESALVTR
jgi:hypothetical protein